MSKAEIFYKDILLQITAVELPPHGTIFAGIILKICW